MSGTLVSFLFLGVSLWSVLCMKGEASYMPIYHPTPKGLINREEFLSRKDDDGISFAVGQATASAAAARGFVQISVGQPLNILLRQVYTGRFPQKHLLSNSRPMLLTTALKDITTTSAAVRAVNIVKDKVQPGKSFSGPAASAEGTNLVYYSPAVASPLITITVELIFQDLDPQIFDRASQLFGSLGGIPIFMPASGYLMGASTILKLAGNIGQALLDGQPVLSESMQIDFSFGGGSIPVPGYWVFSANPIDLNTFKFDPANGLIDNSGKPYSGDEPYVVLSVDGTKVQGLSNFTPLLASAGVLGRFYNQKDGSEVLSDTILNSVKLYNDLTYRKKADDLKQQLAGLQQGSSDFANVKTQFDALVANIEEPRLKPS